MALTNGTRLGDYEVSALIGAGGIGEVYRARDTKLGRDVAIKILPDAFSKDRERLARFEREARLFSGVTPGKWDVAPDGEHFVVIEPIEAEPAPTRLYLVMNWGEELKRPVPANK